MGDGIHSDIDGKFHCVPLMIIVEIFEERKVFEQKKLSFFL